MGLYQRIFGTAETPATTPTPAQPAAAERDLTRADFPLFGTPTASGVPVSVRSALSIPTVYAAVSNVADTISTLPLPVYQRDGDQGGEKDYSHPVYRLLNNAPNSVQTAKAWRASMVVDLMTAGEHFSEIVSDGYGVPVEVWRIDPAQVRTEWSTDGRTLVYYVGGRPIDSSAVIHVIGFSLCGFRGVSPFTLCRNSLSLTLALDMFGAKFFANSCRPGGMLLKPPGMSPEESEAAKRSWTDAHSGVENTGKTAVMPGGFDFKQFSLAPEEGQYHESRIMQSRECQRLTRTPPPITNDYERQTWSNIQYARMDYVQNTIRPLVVAIEQELNRKLLTEAEQSTHYVEHTLEGLLRGSPSEQIDMLVKAVGGPFYTPNEARKILGMSAHEDGDQIGPKPAPVAPAPAPGPQQEVTANG